MLQKMATEMGLKLNVVKGGVITNDNLPALDHNFSGFSLLCPCEGTLLRGPAFRWFGNESSSRGERFRFEQSSGQVPAYQRPLWIGNSPYLRPSSCIQGVKGRPASRNKMLTRASKLVTPPAVKPCVNIPKSRTPKLMIFASIVSNMVIRRPKQNLFGSRVTNPET